jgi:F-type H+-transporting ATPase subunit b
MKNLAKEQEKLIADTKLEQSRILKEAAEERRQIIDQAKTAARDEADNLLAKAKTEIAAEKESAIREVRKEVALLSVKVAEKIVRKDLSSDEAQADYLNRLVDEMSASGNQHKTETN